MAVCNWCGSEMTTGRSCVVAAMHRDGRRLDLPPFGHEPGRRSSAARCGDCGVAVGGWHHPGCDLQQCPSCGDQLLSCGCRFDEDGNGGLVERAFVGGVEVLVHQSDVPESDITTVRGIRCTTPLSTVIDLAPELAPDELKDMVRDYLGRRLFTVEEAWWRLAQPDMADRRGAHLLRAVLPPREQSPTSSA